MSQPSSFPQVPFQLQDIQQILRLMGHNPQNIYIDRHSARGYLIQMGKMFIQQILDCKKYGSQIDKNDIQKQIKNKFPQIISKKYQVPKEILEKRFNQLDKLDQKI